MSRAEPQVTRNAFERVYDMILSYGTETYEEWPREAASATSSSTIPTTTAATPSSASTSPLAGLVNAFKSAAQGYGIEKRVLLLHGPVGSSKSTIARLLKKGLEALFADATTARCTRSAGSTWKTRATSIGARCTRSRCTSFPSGSATRSTRPAQRRAAPPATTASQINGELCPFCRYVYDERLKHYDGDWTRVVARRPRQAA